MTNNEPATVIPSEVEEAGRNYFFVTHRDPSTPLRFAQDDLASVIRASSFIRHSSFVIRHFP